MPYKGKQMRQMVVAKLGRDARAGRAGSAVPEELRRAGPPARPAGAS